MTGSAAAARHAVARERAAIVGLQLGMSRRTAVEASLDELAGLVAAAGGTVVGRTLQERPKPDPALFIGRGKAEALATALDELDADLVVVDHELTPGQLRNLEATLDRRVLDRTQLILDIFAARARTREGKLQVELAQLRYLLPRLAGAGSRLSRLGAGIGTRGPGEMKLETDRRRIRQRISRLSRDLEPVRRRRGQLRDRRRQRAAPMRRIRLSFDDRRATDRRGMSAIYRFGRVLRHVSDNGRAVIDVEAPSHLVDRWRRGVWPEQEHTS